MKISVALLASVVYFLLAIFIPCYADGTSPVPKATLQFPLYISNKNVRFVGQPWLSNNELLHFGKDGKLYSWDIPRRTDTPLPGVNRQIKTSSNSLIAEVSPSGSWVIWSVGTPEGNFFVTDLAGRRCYSWPSDAPLWGDFQWCADGSHFIRIILDMDASMALNMKNAKTSNGNQMSDVILTETRIFNVETPKHIEPITHLPTNLAQLEILGAISPTQYVARKRDLAWIPSESTFHDGKGSPGVGQQTTEFTKVQSIYICNPLHSSPTAEYSITCPEPILRVRYMSTSNRLLWLTFDPISHPGSKIDEEIWLSKVDGSDMKEIHGLPRPSNSSSSLTNINSAPQFYNLLFDTIYASPDGETISFIVNYESLWTTPAN